MCKNIFLYHERYSQVREVWDTETNGDIDIINPSKHDKVEYSWICPICRGKFSSRPLSIASKIDKGKLWCSNCGKGFNPAKEGESFEDYYPELAKLWDYSENKFLKPSMLRCSSNLKVYWICPDCGESYKRSPNQQKNTKGGYCENCYSFHKKFKYGSLQEIHPSIALDWSDKNEISASEVSSSEVNKRRYWCCHKCGNEWDASVSDIVNSISKCGVCSGRKLKEGYTDFKTHYPEISKNWDYNKNTLSPTEILYSASGSYYFICPTCGRSHEKTLDRVTKTGAVCYQCNSYFSSLKKRGSLADRRPDLAVQLDEERSGVSAKNVLPNSTKSLWWKCDKGHSFLRSPHERVKSMGVCPVCDGKEVLIGFNDFEANYPELLEYWCYDMNTILPSQVTKNSSTKVWWVCPSCSNVYQAMVGDRTRSVACPECKVFGYSSQEEKELLSTILSWGIEAEENVRLFEGSMQSIDIYIPSKKLAIGFNGLYWHSERVVGRSYHYDKYMKCKSMGISLLYVWEDDFLHNREVLYKTLKRKLGVSNERKVGARSCVCKPIDYKSSSHFLDINHIQGKASGSIYIGIFDKKEELLGVGVFESAGDFEYSLKRYATNCILQGGFSKMINYFKNNYWCESISTFADNGISDGSLYKDNGFVVESVVPYDYQYIVKGRRVHKFNYRKARFKNDKNLVYEEGKTEAELADMNGLTRIWDSGKVKYVRR